MTDQTYQVDIGSSQSVNSPEYLICAHQTQDPIKRRSISIFDNLDVKKYFVETDGVRFPRDSVLANYELN